MTAAGAQFQPVAVPRAFEDVVRQLRAAIVAGTFRPGDRLPAERELAERFQVSRASVREALRVLETLGIIGVRRGPDNGAVLLTEPGNVFPTVLELLVALGHVPLADVVEFRAVLECAAAERLSADPEAAVAHLGALLTAMEQAPDQEAFHRLDAEFHVALVRSAGNQLLNLVQHAADGILRQLIRDVAQVAMDWDTMRTRLIAEHRAIHAAIATGDGSTAARLVREHVRRWGGSVLAAR